MLKSTIIPASLLALALSGSVMAQDAGKPPGAMPEAVGKSAQEMAAKTPLFIPEQTRDQVLAKSIIGASVVDVSGNEVGTVKDLILDKQGKAVGVVVSWGGLLGIGGKNVGISIGSAQLQDGKKRETKLVRLNVTKDAVEAAPEFMDATDQKADTDRSNRSSGTGQTGDGMSR